MELHHCQAVWYVQVFRLIESIWIVSSTKRFPWIYCRFALRQLFFLEWNKYFSSWSIDWLNAQTVRQNAEVKFPSSNVEVEKKEHFFVVMKFLNFYSYKPVDQLGWNQWWNHFSQNNHYETICNTRAHSLEFSKRNRSFDLVKFSNRKRHRHNSSNSCEIVFMNVIGSIWVMILNFFFSLWLLLD